MNDFSRAVDLYAVPGGEDIPWSCSWNGTELNLDVEHIAVRAGLYDAEEVAANLNREIERAVRESPVLRRITELLPYVPDDFGWGGGVGKPVVGTVWGQTRKASFWRWG